VSSPLLLMTNQDGGEVRRLPGAPAMSGRQIGASSNPAAADSQAGTGAVRALENDITDWIATWNDNPRPFTWTKTADQILNPLAAYLAKLGMGHP
jgi:hypothetical protein